MLARLEDSRPLGRRADARPGPGGGPVPRSSVGGQQLIEGWIEGPCAESADLRGINRLMTDFFDDPAFVRDLFDFVLEMELHFAQAQVEAGADIIGVGDAAASLVGPQIYEEFVWPYEKKMIDALHAMGTRVRLHICGNTRRILAGHRPAGLRHGRHRLHGAVGPGPAEMGPQPGAAGNLDPVKAVRNGTPQTDRRGHGPVPCRGRAAVHRRRRLRGAPRHARGKRAGDGPRARTFVGWTLVRL